MHLHFGDTTRTVAQAPPILIERNQRASTGEKRSPKQSLFISVGSLKDMSIVSQPPISVLVRGIVVRPVDNAAFWIPFVFAVVFDDVADPQVGDGWC